jgi:predicted transcriptional regulator
MCAVTLYSPFFSCVSKKNNYVEAIDSVLQHYNTRKVYHIMSKNAALLEMLSGNAGFSGQQQQQEDSLIEGTALIVSAFISNNPCNLQDVPQFIAQTRQALQGANGSAFNQALGNISQTAQGFVQVTQEKKQPAVPISKSIQQDYIVCLEDGAKLKMLKRYIARKFNLTPQQYREKWGLAKDYPMVAPSYSKERSNVAVRSGLGQGNTGRRKGNTDR